MLVQVVVQVLVRLLVQVLVQVVVQVFVQVLVQVVVQVFVQVLVHAVEAKALVQPVVPQQKLAWFPQVLKVLVVLQQQVKGCQAVSLEHLV